MVFNQSIIDAAYRTDLLEWMEVSITQAGTAIWQAINYHFTLVEDFLPAGDTVDPHARAADDFIDGSGEANILDA
jgi:hypothetical protein